ncbi:MAG: Histidine kinase [Bathelium mastoideum]|nr:MAG: Histidine kinase [Bathelium mastoideum]
MRIPIREQLGLVILFCTLVGLAVIAIATWVTNHSVVLGLREQRLSIVASLKAGQLTSNFQLMGSSVRAASTRVLLQNAIQQYNNGDTSAATSSTVEADLKAGLQGGQQAALLLQAVIYPNTSNGPSPFRPIFNATGDGVSGVIQLPYKYSNGTPVTLGDENAGYPPELYPNITFSTPGFNTPTASYNGRILNSTNSLLLGPLLINSTFALVSITEPIINVNNTNDILGWLSVVIDARLIFQVLDSPIGLDKTGIAYIIGPGNSTNLFPRGVIYNSAPAASSATTEVRFVLPVNSSNAQRHPAHAYGSQNLPFNASAFPAVESALSVNQNAAMNAGSAITAKNENGLSVSLGFAMPGVSICNWVLFVEQLHGEVWAPINQLRNVLLACVFATVGGLIILTWPVAHVSVNPIRRLRAATAKSILPPGYSEHEPGVDGLDGPDRAAQMVEIGENSQHPPHALARKEGFFAKLAKWRDATSESDNSNKSRDSRQRTFRIPGKVKVRKHFLEDELTDLMEVYNEMSDELMMQYDRLDERVKQRTIELEQSKKAAEAANESKTLFIANISHELKTPLNGILGMCAVCMSEEDPIRLKRSLGIIYKSGDLLLNLLTDLLTFSKNQVGQQITLDEKEFRLRDISSQVLAIFDKQAKEGGIDLQVNFVGPLEVKAEDGAISNARPLPFPTQIGRVKDMILFGDQQRILQVLINLVSNSLKFTPKGGSVIVTVRCHGILDATGNSRVGSFSSKMSKMSVHYSALPSPSGALHRGLSDSTPPTPKMMATANEINALDRHDSRSQVGNSERSPSPPPGRTLLFEFEVKDTGPGIAPHQQQRIFEPFVQGDLGLSKKYGGTGLGLSICSQLAKLMRGTIGLHSQLGVGSTFTMSIPLRHVITRADSEASSNVDVPLSRQSSIHLDEVKNLNLKTPPMDRSAASSAHGESNSGPVAFEADSQPRLVGLSQPFFASPQPLESPGSQQAAVDRMTAEASRRADKVKVLVAEDNKVNQEVVLRMLKLEDIYDVTVAADGQEALDHVKASMAAARPFNLIFMDVQMPNLDGLESTRLIRQAGYEAPIVALTAFSEESNVKECMASGMDHFLSKPIRRPALKKVLKTYCPPIQEVEEMDGSVHAGATGQQKEKAVSRNVAGLPIVADEGPSSTVVPTVEEPEGLPEISPAVSPLS